MRKYAKKITIPGASAQDIYQKITDGMDDFLDRFSVGKLVVTRHDDTQSIEIESSHVVGTLKCDEGLISVTGKLSLFARPFKSKMDAAIDSWVSSSFGEEVTPTD